MYSILIVLIALGLFAALLYAGTSSLKIDNYLIKSNKGIIESNAMSLATQFTAYENLKGYPLQELNWESEIFSLNRFTAKTLENTTWSYHSDNDGVYFCLSGQVNAVNYSAMKLAEQSATDIAYTGISCGSKELTTHTGSFPTEFSVTYWIR